MDWGRDGVGRSVCTGYIIVYYYCFIFVCILFDLLRSRPQPRKGVPCFCRCCRPSSRWVVVRLVLLSVNFFPQFFFPLTEYKEHGLTYSHQSSEYFELVNYWESFDKSLKIMVHKNPYSSNFFCSLPAQHQHTENSLKFDMKIFRSKMLSFPAPFRIYIFANRFYPIFTRRLYAARRLLKFCEHSMNMNFSSFVTERAE